MGVMVPCQQILDTAREHNADIIGLSGLITPSLEEMAHVAKEMERQGFRVPLLIGGATTSRVHTAVKIAPNYASGATVYVTDASRAVGVCSNLLSGTLRDEYIAGIKADYAAAREQHEGKKGKAVYVTLAEARARGLKTDWKNTPAQTVADGVHKPRPPARQDGIHRLDAVLPCVNCRTHQNAGQSGQEARKCADARCCHRQKWLTAVRCSACSPRVA
jgi:5-methyltetrahydrofolate--homocysteine methyltransferase